MKKRTNALLFSAFLLLLTPDQVFAKVTAKQQPEELLKTAWGDERLKLTEEAVKISSEAASVNPLIKSELRIERGDINEPELKAGIRLYPKSYGEFTKGRKFQKALEANQKFQRTQTLSSLLSSRYELLARIALLREKKKISEELSDLSRRSNNALAYIAQKDRAELKSFVKFKGDLGKIDLKIAEIEKDYNSLQSDLKRIRSAAHGFTAETVDVADLATMSEIRARLIESEKDAVRGAESDDASLNSGTTLTSLSAAQDLAASTAALEYDQAKSGKLLDHLEISAKEDKKDPVISVQVAFNIPFFGAPDLSSVDKQIRLLHEKRKLIETQKIADPALSHVRTELKTLLTLHTSLNERHAKMSLQKMKQTSRAISARDPLLGLDLQRGWFESQEQLLDLEFRIRLLYIQYLHESSTIAQTPEINYFSQSKRRIN